MPRAASADDAGWDEAARHARRVLEALVAADTSNPPGAEARAAAILAERLAEGGIESERSEFAPGRENLLARLPGAPGAEALLLLAHLDVVGAGGQDWSSPPHRVTERDGFLVGRGVSDDLGMAAIAVEVAILLRASGKPLRRPVVLAFTGDEESGGEGIRRLLRDSPGSLAAEIALNEGGGPRLGEDGRVQLLVLQVAEKTYQDFTLRVRGPSGHSSMPRPGAAIGRLAAALARLSASPFPPRLLPATRAFLASRAAVEPEERAADMRALAAAKGRPPAAALARLDRDPFFAALLRTTCVATMIRGGTRVNALPVVAEASVNCRILPDETVEQTRRALVRAVADDGVEIEVGPDFGAGPASPVEGAVPAAVRRIAGRMWPGAPTIPYLGLGATDSRFLRAAGVAAYGLSPIPMTEDDARRAHGVDERIPVAGLRSGVEFLHRLVLELAAEPEAEAPR